MATKEVDVTNTIVEIQCPDFGSALPIYVHEGLLDGSSTYIVNAIAAGKALQDDDNGKILVFVEVPHHAMAHFVRWLYTGRSGIVLDRFQTLADALDLSKWTKDYLRNSDYRDQLVGEVIRLVTGASTQDAPSQVVSAILNSFGDLDGGIARFLVDWIVRSPLVDTAVCMQMASAMAAGYAGENIYREFTRAFLEMKMSGNAGALAPWFNDLCRYHEHAPDAPCLAQAQVQPGLIVSRRALIAPARKDKARAQRSPQGQQRCSQGRQKYDASELLEYAGPDEDFTTMAGDQRQKVYKMLWGRMRFAKRMTDSGGRNVKQEDIRNGKDIAVEATANSSSIAQLPPTGGDAKLDAADNNIVISRPTEPSARAVRAEARQLQKESLQTPPPTPE